MRLLIAIYLLCVVGLHSEPSKYIRLKSAGNFTSGKTGNISPIPSGFLYDDREHEKLEATALSKDKQIRELKAVIEALIKTHELSEVRTKALLDVMKQRTAIQNSIKQDLVFKDKLRQDISKLQSKENRTLRRQNQLEKAKGILMFFLGSKL